MNKSSLNKIRLKLTILITKKNKNSATKFKKRKELAEKNKSLKENKNKQTN